MTWKWIKSNDEKESPFKLLGNGFNYNFRITTFTNPLTHSVYYNLFFMVGEKDNLYKSYSSIRQAMADAMWFDIGCTREERVIREY